MKNVRPNPTGWQQRSVHQRTCFFGSYILKKINNPNLPVGLTVNAFSELFTSSLFTFQASDARDDFKKSDALLIANQHYYPSKLKHFIVCVALFLYDNKRGSFLTVLVV
jgi:hypothetical protein